MDAISRPEPDLGPARPPGALAAGWLMAGLFARLILGRRRALVAGLALLVPLGLSLYWRIADGGDGAGFFLELSVGVLLQFFALGLTLYLGVAAVRDEIEDRTIVYLFARPVARWVILAGKLAAVAAGCALALGATAVVAYALVVSADGFTGLVAGLGTLVRVLAALGLACAAYTGLFGLLGVIFSKPMIPAVVLAFGWEGVLANMPGGLPRATLMFYLKSLLGLAPEADSLLAMLVPPIAPVPAATAAAVLCAVAGVLFAMALWIGSQREFSL